MDHYGQYGCDYGQYGEGGGIKHKHTREPRSEFSSISHFVQICLGVFFRHANWSARTTHKTLLTAQSSCAVRW